MDPSRASAAAPRPHAAAVVCVGDPGINALATVRSLGRRGVPVHCVTLEGTLEIASASRYCTARTHLRHLDDLYRVLSRLGEPAADPMVLFVDNDRMLRVLAPHAEELHRRFRVAEPIEHAERWMDKGFQARMAREAGLAVPRTWYPRTWSEMRAIRSRNGNRLIAKPAPERLSPGKQAAFKAEVADDAEALAERLRPLVCSPEEVMVQEFVEGDDSCIYGGLAYRALDGRCIVLSVRKHRQTVPGAGVMAVGQVVDAPEVRRLTVRLLDKVGYRGMVNTELKRCPRSGRFYFIEWNNRPGYFHSLGWRAHFDGPWLAYCDHAGTLQLPDLRHDSGHYWITFHGDLMHLSKAPRLLLRPGTWAPYISGPEWAVFDAADPGPWLRSTRYLGAWLVQHAVRFARRRLPFRRRPRRASALARTS